jgi:hypothetical protein
MKFKTKFLEDDAANLGKKTSPKAPAPGTPGLNAGAKKTEDDAPPADPAAGADHDDAAQDIELFKKLIADATGSKDEPSEALVGTTKDMYQTAKESGMSHEEALTHAGAGLKMAKMMSDKKEKQAAEATDPAAAKDPKADCAAADDSTKESKGKSETEESDKEESEEKKEKTEKKEAASSLKAQNAQLAGENAKLKEALKKVELTAHLDKLCRESGFSSVVTKSFRELVKNSKRVEEINESWKHFKSAVDGQKEAGRVSLAESVFSFSPEKTMVESDGDGSGSDLKSSGFGDCT